MNNIIMTKQEGVPYTNELEDEYDESPEVSNELLQGCLFNVIGEEEFIDYLEKRYKRKFSTYEVCIRHIIFEEE